MMISKFSIYDIERNIKEFENKNQIKLPEDYKKFLMSYNGGITPETSFRIGKISSDIVGFYGLGNADKEFNFAQFNEMNVLSNYINIGMLPIAYNDFGDKITLSINEDSLGEIYYFYHDKPENFIKLTDEFNKFIKSCKSKKIGYIPSIEERKQMMIANGLGDKINEYTIKGWQAEIDEYNNINQVDVVL